MCVLLPATHPLARRSGLRLGDLADALPHCPEGVGGAPSSTPPTQGCRWPTSGPRTVAMASAPSLRYDGTDVRTLTALAATGHGLTLLPRSAGEAVAGTVAVPVTEPRVVHRTELVHAGSPRGAAAAVVEALTARG